METKQSNTKPLAMRWGRACQRIEHEDAVKMVRAFHIDRETLTVISARQKCALSTAHAIAWGKSHPDAYEQVKAEIAERNAALQAVG